MNLFSEAKQHFKRPQAELIYVPQFFSKAEADRLLQQLKIEIPWQQDDITVFGKTYKQPRLTALYGTTQKPYSYSNITMHPKPLTETLDTIKTKVETFSATPFNTILANLYRDGNDSNGWHSDNEKELGINPVIASLSFGAERPFHFKHKTIKTERHKLVLEHGSLLLMKGEMQHFWRHQIAKTKQPITERINLTFRALITPSEH